MLQILLRTNTFIIYSSYVMMALGSIVAMAVILKEARRTGIDTLKIYPLLFYVYLSALLGGKGFKCLLNEYSLDLLCFIRFWEGSMTFYGGFLLAGLVFVLYGWMQRLEILKLADIFVPGLALFLALYRIGCFLNGCCWGKVTNLPWALNFPMFEEARHPTQLYSSLNAMILFSIVWAMRKRKGFEGQLSVIFVFYYSMTRFIIEVFRDDPRRFLTILDLRLSESQAISIPLLISSIIMHLYLRQRASRIPS